MSSSRYSMSSDGDDSEGSLRDFIVDDDEYNSEDDRTMEVTDFAQTVTMEVVSDATGPRRSSRRRRAPQRYVDPNFAEIFMEDATPEEIAQIFADHHTAPGEEEAADVEANDDTDDGDYEMSGQEDDDDDEEYEPSGSEEEDDDDDDEEDSA